MEELLTVRELAKFLRVNEKRVYQLIREFNIPRIRISGKWLFPKKHILSWIDENLEREKSIFIAGSDDMLLARILSMYSNSNFPDSLSFYCAIGSEKGIMALSYGKVHACCIHLFDEESKEYNIPFYPLLWVPYTKNIEHGVVDVHGGQ